MGVVAAAAGEHDSRRRVRWRTDPATDAGNGRGRQLGAAVACDLGTGAGPPSTANASMSVEHRASLYDDVSIDTRVYLSGSRRLGIRIDDVRYHLCGHACRR